MRKYLKKVENDIIYIAEGYDVESLKESGFIEIADSISSGRKLLRRLANDMKHPVYGVEWKDYYVMYAITEKENVSELSGYTVFLEAGPMIGRGGRLWSKYTVQKLEN